MAAEIKPCESARVPGAISPRTELGSRFVVATPQRSVCDANARVLERVGLLRFLALGTRRGTEGVSAENTRLNPWIGLCAYAAARTLGTIRGETFRFHLLPWFDKWVLKQLRPGDHLISSYGYTNACFEFVRRHGGKTFVDAGNSHIENFWEILREEHRIWKCPYPPVSPFWYERAREMLTKVDYVLSPSSYVTRSFLERGFKPGQILANVYPVDLSVFQPAAAPRPANRPLTLINTGMLSLRKGTPYLLEAFKLVRRQVPEARLLLTRTMREEIKPIMEQYRDLPLEWAPSLPPRQLAERLRSADIFVLPSLEEGLVRTAIEAMACGLQVVLTPNTGASDFVRAGSNGEIVPIRDAVATADAILRCSERVFGSVEPPRRMIDEQAVSFEHFQQAFLQQLAAVGMIAPSAPSSDSIR
jgi:glycosyltransferase involved in cell wall biosynthesis